MISSFTGKSLKLWPLALIFTANCAKSDFDLCSDPDATAGFKKGKGVAEEKEKGQERKGEREWTGREGWRGLPTSSILL